jgi:exonuclease III
MLKCHRKIRMVVIPIFFISSTIILSLTIDLDLLRQTIEPNPGEMKTNPDLTIVSYNCTGLGERSKLKRLMTKLNSIVTKGGIVLLQETHIVDTKYLEMIWKHNFVSNGFRTNSAGVIILFHREMKIHDVYRDKNGRTIVAALENDEDKFIVVNSYFPNNHKDAINFAEDVYVKILEFQTMYPNHITFFGGDLNMCSNLNDCLNRNISNSEKLLAAVVDENNDITNLVYAYRHVNKKEGYTWRRGLIMSRLDHIFVSNSITPLITSASTDWALEASDHAAVIIQITKPDSFRIGPGSTKVNLRILENPEIAKQVEVEIVDMMNQAQKEWDPHKKLEFLKVTIRSVIASKTSEIRSEIKKEIVDKQYAANQLVEMKVKLLKNNHLDEVVKQERLNAIDLADQSTKLQLLDLRKKMSETSAFISRAKWFEYGEKSNSFFLNLEKSKQQRKIIREIKDNDKHFVSQDKVSEGITDFYRSLYSNNSPTTHIDNNNFYQYAPKLSQSQREEMDKKLTMNDLWAALSSSKDSAPGPDGIGYSFYKKYWHIVGPIILSSWEYSEHTVVMPDSHKESLISILPKEGKDLKDKKTGDQLPYQTAMLKLFPKHYQTKSH